MLSNTISAWSIFFALIGVSLNAIFIKPYTGIMTLGDSSKKIYDVRKWMGYIGNSLIVLGTLGQFISIVFL